MMLFSLAAVFAAPARRTAGRTSDLVAADEVPGPAPGRAETLAGGVGLNKGLNSSSVCAPRSSQFWLLGSHHKTGTELVRCSPAPWTLAPRDS